MRTRDRHLINALAGAGFLRIDVFEGSDCEAKATQYYPPSSVYCLTPTTEEAAREAASAEEEDWTCTHGPGDDCAKCAFNLGKKRPGYETHESNHESGDGI